MSEISLDDDENARWLSKLNTAAEKSGIQPGEFTADDDEDAGPPS